jgi:hypothetical protein
MSTANPSYCYHGVSALMVAAAFNSTVSTSLSQLKSKLLLTMQEAESADICSRHYIGANSILVCRNLRSGYIATVLLRVHVHAAILIVATCIATVLLRAHAHLLMINWALKLSRGTLSDTVYHY